ncbi:hypothetical protein RO21_01475 [[Actinobacillus] muris]|uniref:Uncharacterized protein n=1 Tax=Muribacter muris TaxID=67855 RepID=A0A0J5P7U8_9PAST|nr:hypothetical protein [Muribacter muris]KMK52286.1 hypothetical protein RO21_01475 [[Actinobacillus] muris] [Muribacter muris]
MILEDTNRVAFIILSQIVPYYVGVVLVLLIVSFTKKVEKLKKKIRSNLLLRIEMTKKCIMIKELLNIFHSVRRVTHKIFGEGTVIKLEKGNITIAFSRFVEKTFKLDLCLKHNLISY